MLLVVAAAAVGAGESRMPLILDTDMGSGNCIGVEDAGALAVVNALQDNGEVDLLAVMLSSAHLAGAGAVSAIQRFYGYSGVPIGAYKGCDPIASPGDCGSTQSWAVLLADSWASRTKSSADVPEAVVLYRQVLAAQPDHSVVIVSVGMLTNLALLLKSGADEHSPQRGEDLFAAKVRLVGIKGGNYPEGDECSMRGASAA